MRVPLFLIMFKPINHKQLAELSPQPGLEYWFRERRTIVDFRRGPLGPHFDRFAAYLKAKGYSQNWGSRTLAKCCLFNAFLIDQGITKCEELSESLIDSFLDLLTNPIGREISVTPANVSARTRGIDPETDEHGSSRVIRESRKRRRFKDCLLGFA